MLAELIDLVQLMESISWSLVKEAFMSILHDIEAGEISWMDRQAVMQRRMNHTHAASVAPQPTRVQVSK